MYQTNSSNVVQVDEERILEIDKSLALLKAKNNLLFSVVKWRYVYNESYMEITHRLGKRSPKVAGEYLRSAENELEDILKC